MALPEKCDRCKGNMGNTFWALTLPTRTPKKRGKTIVYSYSQVLCICKKCQKELVTWALKKG
jgi:hypothetical protein